MTWSSRSRTPALLIEAIASSRLEVLSGVGHFPQVEAPERFNDVLVDFLATTEAGAVDVAGLRDALVANA